MEDQGKRLLLAVGIIAVMYWLFVTFIAPPPPQQAQQQPPASQPAPPAPDAPPAQAGAAPAAATPTPAAPACEVEKDGAPRWDTPEYTATFSRCGGALASLQLKGSQYRQEVDGKDAPIDLVRTADDAASLPLQTQVEVPRSGGTDTNEPRVPLIPERASWELVGHDDKQVAFRWTAADGALQVTKTYRRLPGKYTIGVDLEVRNASTKQDDRRLAEASFVLFGRQDANVSEPGIFTLGDPQWESACYVNGELQKDAVKTLLQGPKTRAGDVRWAGLFHKYFLLAVAPTDQPAGGCTASATQAGKDGVIRTALVYSPPTALAPGETTRRSVVVYAGPKLLDQLEAIGAVVGGKDTKLDAAVELGWLAFIARPMLSLLKVFHGWVLNWGIAIILLTITVKLLTLYWTHKSMKSMKGMARLKPKFDELREKYGNDKQRQNQELMNLYRAHGVNPLSGCLPMILQMPIWIALYQTLGTAAELHQAPFFGWVQDLTAPDPFYVIPVSMTVLMFVQAKLTPTTGDAMQQKMMQYMMPIVFGGLSLMFPSGLTLYMLTNTVLSMAHQLYMNKTDPVTTTPSPAPAPTPPSTSPPTTSPSPGARVAKGRSKARGGKRVAKA